MWTRMTKFGLTRQVSFYLRTLISIYRYRVLEIRLSLNVIFLGFECAIPFHKCVRLRGFHSGPCWRHFFAKVNTTSNENQQWGSLFLSAQLLNCIVYNVNACIYIAQMHVHSHTQCCGSGSGIRCLFRWCDETSVVEPRANQGQN